MSKTVREILRELIFPGLRLTEDEERRIDKAEQALNKYYLDKFEYLCDFAGGKSPSKDLLLLRSLVSKELGGSDEK